MDLLSVKDVAKKLNLHTHTIYKLVNEGYFKSIKIGKKIFINADDLEKKLKGDNNNGI